MSTQKITCAYHYNTLEVGGTTTTGSFKLVPIQTTGSVEIATGTSRAGPLVIGDAAQTGCTCAITSGAITLNAVGGTTGAISATGATTATVTAGTILTLTGASSNLTSSTGATSLTSQTGTTITAGGTSSFAVTSGNLTVNSPTGDTLLGGATAGAGNTKIHESSTTGTCSIGTNMTTGLINLGTGVSRTGLLSIGNAAGDTDIDGKDTTITSAATTTLASTGGTTITAGGASSFTTTAGSVTVGAPTTSITFLGGIATGAGNTLIHNEGTTGNVNIGRQLTTGEINIAVWTNNTGLVQIGQTNANTNMGGNAYAVTVNSYTLTPSGSTNIASSNVHTGAIAIGHKDATSSVCTVKGVNMMPVKASFTPTLGDGTNAFTTTTLTGQYVLWGQMVAVTMKAIWTGKGSASGTLQLGNLPFNFPSGASASVQGSCDKKAWAGVAGGSMLSVKGAIGGSYVLFQDAGSSIAVSAVSATGNIEVSIQYLLDP